MKAHAEVVIAAPRETVWSVVTDIQGAAATIKAIEKVAVLDTPPRGLVGLKWRETRTMFGKQATEVMWITAAEENSHYETRAESHGSIYRTRVLLAGRDGSTVLRMEFEGTPVKLGAKLAWGVMGFMLKGATRKALQKDLDDIKQAIESRQA